MRSIYFKLSTAAFAISLLAGCQSSRVNGIDTYEPITPAPAGSVQQSQLPAPSAPSAAAPGTTSSADPAAFPTAPAAPAAPTPADGSAQLASANAPDVTVGAVAGVWNVNLAGQSCKVATPQTKYGQGFRAGPLKCPGDMANVKSWNVSGKQLVLYDESGATIARLYSSGTGRFDGQTSSGSAISFSR